MSRRMVKLSKTLHRDLSRYAVAASAAGVSVLAFGPATEAQIVYTPAHEIIGCNGTMAIDLNHDGITDVTIREIPWTYGNDGLFPGNSVQAKPAPGAGFKPVSYDPEFASDMVRGSQIGPPTPFRFRVAVLFQATSFGTYYSGVWSSNGLLGIRFRVGQDTHYGWARISIQVSRQKRCLEALLTGYAYESQAGKSIRAGDTGQEDLDDDSTSQTFPVPIKEQPTLGALALGSTGIAVWRSNALR